MNSKAFIPKVSRDPAILLAFLAVTIGGPADAQFDSTSSRVSSVYPDISIEAATHLRTAASYAGEQNWSEATELYQRLIEKFGDKVVPMQARPVYVTVRDYCHMQLASMPPAARMMYRQRVDAQAEAWFRAGWRDRDHEQLSRVVEQAFASSWGDDALNALAEIAFESGEFDQAQMWWKKIAPYDVESVEPGQNDAVPTFRGLTYPDTDLDRSLLAAKQLLCQIFLGRSESAVLAISAYRKSFPNARGVLAGVEGLLAERLAAIAQEVLPIAAIGDSEWTTFAGAPQRTKIIPRSVDIGSVQWTVPLPPVAPPRINLSPRPTTTHAEDLLSYHPLVVQDQVIVGGRDEIRAFDLHEGAKNGGEPLWNFRLRDLVGQPSVVAVRPSSGSPHYSLTAYHGRLYVRMGAPETTLPLRRGGQPDSYIVCLDLAADGKELWRVQPDPAEPDLAFEGSPLVAGNNVYIGVTRGGAMTHSFLACYDAVTGAKKWRTLICESSSLAPSFMQATISHNLPTLGGGMVFYSTNLGAVTAIDQRTGRIRWIATYPRKGRDELSPRTPRGTLGRELSPCIYYDGLVLTLPYDGDGVFAFDAQSGELRWRVPEPPELSHMLGVAHGRLICTGNQVLAIDVATGKGAWQWSDNTNMAPFGRGALAGDYVYFPTRTHVYVLDQRTGVLAKPKEMGALQERHSQSPGNIVIADGYLVVAQPRNLTVFCQYEVLINRYRELIAENPRNPDLHFRLARAAEASGAVDLAVEHYRATIEVAPPDSVADDRNYRQMARTHLFSLLKQYGQKAAQESQWARADAQLREAATVAPTTQGKLDALLGIAELWRVADEASKSLAAFQDILGDESLRGLGVSVEGNRTVRSDVEIAGRVEALLDQFGRDVYAPYETAAQALLASAQQNGSLQAAERLLRAYPNSETASHAMLYLAQQYAESKQPALAIAMWKQLLGRPKTTAAVQISALLGLAQLNETQKAWQAARGWWRRLATQFPDSAMPHKPEQSVASFVQEHLSRPPFEDASAAAESDRLPLPLARRWNRTWSDTHRLVVPAGTPPPELGMLLLSSTPQSVEGIAARSGEPVWSLKVIGPVRWAGFYENHLLMGSDTQVVCVTAATGELLWQQGTGSGLPGYSDFQLVEDRLFLREDSRRIVCLSAASGAAQWTYAPTEGTIHSHPFFSAQHVALRTKQPGRFVVLDGDGRRRFETTHTGDAWEHAPLAVDTHRLCMAGDARSIQLIDLNDGKQVWSYTGPNSDQRPIPILGPTYLLVLVSGNTLMRLDVDSGRPMWSSRVSDDVLPRLGTTWAVDNQLFFCVTRDLNLRAFRVADGQLEWEQFLTGPGEQWQLATAGGYVIALPQRPHASDGLPVVICRQADGRLVQRLFFKPHGRESLVYLDSRNAFIGSEREVWMLGKE